MSEEQTLYVNFEDKEIEPFISKEIIDEIYNEYRAEVNTKDFAVIVLDEIHKVPEWERWVRSMLDRRENIKIIVTGSSSKLISPKLATILTERKISYNLFPLSFLNFLEFKGIKVYKFNTKLKNHLSEYLKHGGFPLVTLTEKSKPLKRFLILF